MTDRHRVGATESKTVLWSSRLAGENYDRFQLLADGTSKWGTGSAEPAAVTDSTTGTAANTLAAGAGVYPLSIPIHNLATVADGDVITTMNIPHKFKILEWAAHVTNEVTTAAKATTLNLEIGTTNVTGASIALTSANCATLGAEIASTAITAANTGAAGADLSVEAASTTAFSEGGVMLVIWIQNMDTADAFASLARRV